MRIIDISAAAVVATTSLVLILFLNPAPQLAASQEYVEESAMRTLLAGIVSAKGILWFFGSTMSDVCSTVEAYSNSTLTVSATLDNHECSAHPSGNPVMVILDISFGSREAALEAWVKGGL
jgi:hypothetical protein